MIETQETPDLTSKLHQFHDLLLAYKLIVEKYDDLDTPGLLPFYLFILDQFGDILELTQFD